MSALIHAANWFALKGEGYQFWSGLGSGSPLFAAVVVHWRHHNCYVVRCPRLGHPHPAHDHKPVCRKHRAC